ncbi:hypothetical protein KQX54_019817 [Cotesia glomerata]|uniref:Uncharacterized protein n=1 Tax=Cotesia glomerata TaxID=32391 RepID=A0AAV7I0N0_COTGL|nr:hypothetical protein KQX54_019817 [Cotesia glomerata]
MLYSIESLSSDSNSNSDSGLILNSDYSLLCPRVEVCTWDCTNVNATRICIICSKFLWLLHFASRIKPQLEAWLYSLSCRIDLFPDEDEETKLPRKLSPRI